MQIRKEEVKVSFLHDVSLEVTWLCHAIKPSNPVERTNNKQPIKQATQTRHDVSDYLKQSRDAIRGPLDLIFLYNANTTYEMHTYSYT